MNKKGISGETVFVLLGHRIIDAKHQIGILGIFTEKNNAYYMTLRTAKEHYTDFAEQWG